MGLPSTKQKKTKLRHYVTWFEIPALNLNRAVSFYNHIYGIEMETSESNGYSMALFPADNGIGGAIVVGEGSVPSETGTLVYLNAGKDLAPVLAKIESAGGRIILEKTLISEEDGYFALFIDTEGNKVALHSSS
ncbi:MAG: VOC family protein [Candidatus Kapaibacteriales bacterium]